MKKKVLYITRKYPPKVGGMENFSYNLYKGLDDNKDIDIKLVSLGKSQKHLIWFLPYTCLYVLFNVRKYEVLFIGDAVLCILGTISKIVAPRTRRCINVFGLDITFKNKIYQLYLKQFYQKSSDLFISISKGTTNLLSDRGEFNNTIITPGVEWKEIKRDNSKIDDFREKYNIPDNSLVAITVGRLVKRKGVKWFVENVMQGWNNAPITYFIIGDGDERNEIQKAINIANLGNRVVMMGRVSQEILDEFYENADLFIMPNISVEGDMEGFGIVALEASAAGLLVLASGIEGICDAIHDQKNGLWMETENSDFYREKLTQIAADWNKYKQLRVEYAEYTRKQFDWKVICNSYAKIFNNLWGSEL